MKYTRKQKEAVIKEAIRCIRNSKAAGLCWAISLGMDSVHPFERMHMVSISTILEIFPRFDREIAVEYFKANEYGGFWWENKIKTRIRFLQYLLDGKLPKKRGKK